MPDIRTAKAKPSIDLEIPVSFVYDIMLLPCRMTALEFRPMGPWPAGHQCLEVAFIVDHDSRWMYLRVIDGERTAPSISPIQTYQEGIAVAISAVKPDRVYFICGEAVQLRYLSQRLETLITSVYTLRW